MEDAEAYFRRIYDATFADLTRLCVVRARRVQDVEDLVQNVYERFYKHLKRHGTQVIEDPKAYLAALLYKELARYYRFHALRRETVTDTVPEPCEPVDWSETMALDRLTADEIWQRILEEPVLTQKVFVLYYGYDMSLRQIAESLDVSESAVKNRLYHVRNRIRREMTKEEER